jgi:glutathionylspermidine synthase
MVAGRDYAAFAAAICADGLISDPWFDGAPRFAETPIVLSMAEAQELARAAEDVVAAIDELVRLCQADPTLLDALGLTPFQRLLWLASAPHWHGLARVDAFFTSDGVAICEVNCDTPSGEAEAVHLNALAAAARPELLDPNHAFGARLCRLVELAAAASIERAPRTVGILYPTELTEDLSMILLYRRLFEGRGWAVALGSPFNLTRGARGEPALFDQPCDVVVRHYKTDWWGEREPVWLDDAPPNDSTPLHGPLEVLLPAVLERRCAVVNPLAAVVPQNKRALALLWEERARLSPAARAAVERHIPFTARLETLDPARLFAEQEDWVIKSDYGCEGDEVLLGADLDPEAWSAALEAARPGRWVAQRRFRSRPGAGVRVVNHGVYVMAGHAAGLLTRLSDGKTDLGARIVATLVAP